MFDDAAYPHTTFDGKDVNEKNVQNVGIESVKGTAALAAYNKQRKKVQTK